MGSYVDLSPESYACEASVNIRLRLGLVCLISIIEMNTLINGGDEP